VETVQKLRRALPEQSKMIVAKNNLMKVAVADSKWTTVMEKGCTVSGSSRAAQASCSAGGRVSKNQFARPQPPIGGQPSTVGRC
jgi:hypothetical protein